MRIHVQNDPDDPLYEITPAQWQAAAARAGDIGGGHIVSYGDTREALAGGLRDSEALVTAVRSIIGGLPGPAPRLRLLFCMSAGLDKLAPFDWLPPGASLLNNSGAHTAKAGEYAIMALLMLAGRLPAHLTAQREQRWEKTLGGVVHGRRVTVVGLGALGGAAAEQAARFGMEVTGVRTRAEPHPACVRVVSTDELDAVLPDSEFLVLACPLTPATRNLLDRRRLSLLPRDAGVVNIGRGPLLDEAATCDLLESGRLGGAVLDVFHREPVPQGDRLWTTRNLVMTPHASADDPATYNPLSLDIFFANLRAWAAGESMPNAVDPARGY